MTDPILGQNAPRDWPTAAPDDCPVGPSPVLAGLRLAGRYALYTDADTWFPSWAADGNMYSPWTDGHVGLWASNSKGVCAMTGYARIEGSDPLALTVVPLGTAMGSPGPYVGRYPSGCLHVGGTWYHGTYLVHDERVPDGGTRDLLGPFVGFCKSTDGGATWSADRYTATGAMFGETLEGMPRPTIKLGSPRFVDLGRELEHSPDGKAYFVGFGNLAGHGHLSWILGDAVFLGRADPRDDLTDAAAWEWFAGTADAPRWSQNLADATSIFTWPRSVGQLSMSYVPALGRYLMCVSYSRGDAQETTSYVLDAPSPWGPWTMVGYWEGFGRQAYFLNFPSRFLSEDGARGWLCYSANHTSHYGTGNWISEDPKGSRYAMCLHEVEFLRR